MVGYERSEVRAKSGSLRDRVEDFVERGGSPDVLRLLLKECVDDASLGGLVCVRRLYEDMYGRITFNYELKAAAASTLVVWKDLGLRALAEAAKQQPEFKNTTIAIQLLSSLAAGEGVPTFGEVRESTVDAAIANAIVTSPDLRAHARAHLVDIILSIPDEDDVALRVGNVLQQLSFAASPVARELFAAISKRWLAVSTPVLAEFDELIGAHADDESAFQKFLSDHPQLLDPLAVRVWPQPDLFGFKEPDFIVQRADGTYMVVEIETPGKLLVTSRNHLSAEVTHAEQQATDYRRNLLLKAADLRLHLPDFREPDCLVVVGLERKLDQQQKQVLHDANRNRNHLRIAGFDWLLDRGRTIAANMTQPGVEILSLRAV